MQGSLNYSGKFKKVNLRKDQSKKAQSPLFSGEQSCVTDTELHFF